MRMQFGTFEIDSEEGRLLKRGKPLRLREQPFQVLVALLERAGELVTREELRHRLWGEDTFVDFEIGLNSAVSRLRQVLNDPADAQLLIETVPKRGYRFIGSVPKQPSIAVMPFVNRTSDLDNEYFVDGLSDELIRVLSGINGLKVTGPGAVSRYKNQTYSLKQTGKELAVGALLEGSVWRLEDRVRVGVHLVNVEDGFQIWSERFDSEWRDVFALQDRISQAVAAALKFQFGFERSAERPRNAEAYTAYLKGHHLTKRHTPANLNRALEYFQEALRLDPAYSLPYHGAALHYILGALMGDLEPSKALPRAEDLVVRGLALDKHSAMLCNTRAMLRAFQWRWDEAEEGYQRAMELEPHNAYPRMMHALLCSYLGRHDEALRQAALAVELDPLDPMTNFRVVQSFYYARKYEEAVKRGAVAMELAADFPYTRWYVSLALAASGKHQEAWDLADETKLPESAQPLILGQFGYLAGITGHANRAIDLLGRLQIRRVDGYSPALPIALISLGLGNCEKCLEWLQLAFTEQEPYLGSIGVFPGYDAFRSLAWFREIEGGVLGGRTLLVAGPPRFAASE